MPTPKPKPRSRPKPKTKPKSAPSRIRYKPHAWTQRKVNKIKNVEARGSRYVFSLLSRYPRGMRLNRLPTNVQHQIMGRLTLENLSALSRTSGAVRRTVRGTTRGAVARPRGPGNPIVHW